ncbi:MAG: hypothetical protein U0946_00785 [Patescibacteria group bacterium]|nr:hypothetical protein [Patescibacteria group bacterium]
MIFANIIGTIDKPKTFSGYDTLEKNGFSGFMSAFLYLLMLVSGLFALVNFIIAAYLYLSSNGNPQQISAAGNKILQSLIGLIIISAAFVIAGFLGWFLFKDTFFLFKPKFIKIF